jgi:hypothetical protein
MKKFISVFLLIFLIVGCSYGIEISLFEASPFHPGFKISKPFFAKPIGSAVFLEDFSIVKEVNEKWDYKNPVWSLALKKGSKNYITKIEYGVVPDGFNEVVESSKLRSRIKYLAIGFTGGGRGSIKFMLDNEGKLTKIE